jgi:hypothetical protein
MLNYESSGKWHQSTTPSAAETHHTTVKEEQIHTNKNRSRQKLTK